MNLVRTRVAGRRWEGQEISKNWGNTPEGNTRNTDKLTVSWAFLSCLQLSFFNWVIVALPCCVGFCCTMKWISHIYTHIPSLLILPAVSPPPPPTPGHHRASSWAPFAIQQIPTSALFYTQQCVYVSVNLLIRCTLFPCPLCWHIHSLHLRLYSCPANRSICTIFLDSTYKH